MRPRPEPAALGALHIDEARLVMTCPKTAVWRRDTRSIAGGVSQSDPAQVLQDFLGDLKWATGGVVNHQVGNL